MYFWFHSYFNVHAWVLSIFFDQFDCIKYLFWFPIVTGFYFCDLHTAVSVIDEVDFSNKSTDDVNEYWDDGIKFGMQRSCADLTSEGC